LRKILKLNLYLRKMKPKTKPSKLAKEAIKVIESKPTPLADIFEQQGEPDEEHNAYCKANPPQAVEFAKNSPQGGQELNTSCSSPAEKCELRGGPGYWKDRFGTVHTCISCLTIGRLDQ
jgi:hypothetical protein